MTFSQKLTILIRWIIFFSLLGYIFTMNAFYLYGGFLSVFFILAGYLYSSVSGIAMEGFRADNTIVHNKAFPTLGDENLYLEDNKSNPAPTTLTSNHEINVVSGKKKPMSHGKTITNPVTLEEVLESDYYQETWKNPFGNMLLPEIKYDTDRKSAPPSFNMGVSEDITRNVKKMVQQLNPGIQDTNKQLFGDLYNNFMLDNSNRVFYSMPSTRTENDQSAFANFLYHDLVFSGKESTVEGGIARVQDNYRYTMY